MFDWLRQLFGLSARVVYSEPDCVDVGINGRRNADDELLWSMADLGATMDRWHRDETWLRRTYPGHWVAVSRDGLLAADKKKQRVEAICGGLRKQQYHIEFIERHDGPRSYLNVRR